ncbi:alpha-latrotoxin-Lhe1a [Trichonephila clavipes]|nr:alpha-latrotoxin-Lhe1a [Trichonephila clavipes]
MLKINCQVIYSQFGLAIHQNDHQARRRFVEWAQNEIAVVPDFHKRILFSDEAHFWLNGYVNKQNCRIWSEANPQVYVETPLHPEKLTVWCASWAGGIIGPYFFKNDEGHNVTVNGDRYRAMITNFFIPELNNHDVQELWFQQDGATCHTARATIDLLKDTLGDRLISRFGPVNWPPRSCDLTPLDYFLWGCVKSLVYADKPQTLDHLEDNIRRVIADIRPQMLEKVIENWTSRLDYIRASRGSPMPEIIFKIASCEEYSKVVKELLTAEGIVVTAVTKYFLTPLHLASRRDTETVKTLLESDEISINKKDDDGFTALHAVESGKVEVVKILLETPGLLVNEKEDLRVRTAFHLAADRDRPEIAFVLLNYSGTDVNVRDKYGETLLHIAAYNGYLEVGEKLLEVGINANTRSYEGHTAVYWAAKKGHSNVVKMITDHLNYSEVFKWYQRSRGTYVNELILADEVYQRSEVNARLLAAAKEGDLDLLKQRPVKTTRG